MSSLLKQCAVSVTSIAVLLLAGCSQSTNKPSVSNPSETAAKPAGPPQIVAAKTAFWPMYTDAHIWASDIVVLRITAKELPGFKNADGKAAMWEAVFASPSLHQYRVYTYSIAAVPPSIYKGVVEGIKMQWAGITRDSMAVDLSMFNVDSDAAYKTAAGDAADWLKKNPDKPISTVEIGETYRLPAPVWFVMWGNKKAGGYAALVDANSGQVVKHK
jgi:hypothetical protein